MLPNPSNADQVFPRVVRRFHTINLFFPLGFLQPDYGPDLYWQHNLSPTPIVSLHSSQVTAHNKEC